MRNLRRHLGPGYTTFKVAVFGTEADIFRLRTNYRHEDLSVYPLRIKPQGSRI